MRRIILFLSVMKISAIIKKGNAGILYRTIAPSIGVVSPVRTNIEKTAKIQAQKIFFEKAFFFEKIKARIVTNRMIMFSMAAIRIGIDCASKIKGLKKVV